MSNDYIVITDKQMSEFSCNLDILLGLQMPCLFVIILVLKREVFPKIYI
jgi:hypothetical protein